ncbi:Phosphoglycerol transferase MdoB [Marinobacter segnicrescens]|uniref:Phosphoglycerol transferase MdoB n=1 Tax=Marinobacter segnicrescens TaxID=430453 RepID=A0A1H9YUW2_9GAMM|nr:LTA synthase family protein [Marinobacter segnicrescens]SES72921.1 Phosphoglycerol transferase MdoB [Marinobacter segnicrescens]
MSVYRALQDQRLGLTVVLAFFWLLVVRLCLFLQSGVWPETGWLLLSDAAGAVTVAGLLILARSFWLRTALVVALGCLMTASAMHLAAHGTYPRLSMISKGADPVFLASSVFNSQLLMLPLYLGLAWLLVRIYRWLVPIPPRRITFATLLVVVTTGLYLAASHSLTTSRNNLVASFLAQIPMALMAPAGALVGEEVADTTAPERSQAEREFFEADVASPDVPEPPNVLLIMVEGLSAGYFPSVSEYHELTPVVSLPELENKLAETGFRLYRNTLSMERQTDRGTFAILCGQYPDFQRLSTKMRDVANGEAFPLCMPELLRSHGYTTAYWQAAPLSYMSKDRFMPRAGFIRVTGSEAFERDGETPEGWGPPDPIYFANVAKRLRALDQEAPRWMVTLLNVGTHHPFDTGGKQASSEQGEPPLPTEPLQARRNAMQVMEQSLIAFLDEMDQAGVLDNTLVILTSDESGGFVRQDQESFPLNGNTGVLAVKPPRPEALDEYADRDRIVAQLDIPLTILDATGTSKPMIAMTGRSLLSGETSNPRDLLLADTYTGMKFFLRESGELLACTESLLRCETWTFEPGRLFGTLSPTDSEPFLTLAQRLRLFGESARMPTGPSVSSE